MSYIYAMKLFAGRRCNVLKNKLAAQGRGRQSEGPINLKNDTTHLRQQYEYHLANTIPFASKHACMQVPVSACYMQSRVFN